MAKGKAITPETRESGAAICTEPRTPQIVKWDPQKVKLARQRCSYGDFSLFASLCEEVMSDDRVSQCLEKLYAATTLPLAFELPGIDAKKSKDDPICQAIDSDWWKVQPEQITREIVAWVALANCCLCHVDGWRIDEETGRALPILSVWSLRNLRNDADKGWMVRAARGGDTFGTEEPVIPGDGNWLILLNGSSWRTVSRARGHNVALFWLLKQYAIVDWPQSSERHGQGTNTAQCDDVSKAAKLQDKDRKQLAKDMASMARNGNLVMPPGWKYKLVTDEANSYQTFIEQIKATNEANTIGILGTNLTTEVKDGSFAAASVHSSVDAARMRGLLEFLATNLHDQLWVHWTRFNFAGRLTPYAKWDTTPPEDKKSTAEARKADAEAFGTYVKFGAQIDQLAWFGEGKVQLIPGASREVKVPTATPSVDTRGFAAFAAATSKSEPKSAIERGRGYIDSLATSCCGHAAKELAPTLAAVLSAIEDGTSYEDVKARIAEAYRDELPPSKLLKLTEAALIMGQLAGRETVEQEAAFEE